MTYKEAESAVNVTDLPIAEKIKRLSKLDKEYLHGYIDRALNESGRGVNDPNDTDASAQVFRVSIDKTSYKP